MSETKEFFTFNEYIKKNKLTPSEEDYIEMIYRLFLKEDNIKVSDISEHLNIKPPSVTKMIKKLSEKDLLIYKRYDYVLLSDIGQIVGRELLNRHYVVNEFLNIIGVEENIHEETEKIEHTLSSDTLEKIKELTDFFSDNIEVLNKFNIYKKSYKNRR